MTGPHPAELVARTAYGRLLSAIAARTRDIESAEDALADAFTAALEQWPRDGVPARPEAWLLTAARRRAVDGTRRRVVREEAASAVAALDEARLEREDTMDFLDKRLELMFVCAHPAIDEASRPGLMLQVVLGLDAERIAGAMCVAPKTMGQRLWRAKVKIREAGIPFTPPERAELPGRLAAVLEAIYAAYGSGWQDLSASDERLKGLSDEATFLARLVVQLLPGEPEPRGLLALCLFSSARAAARLDGGVYVPLDEQDTTRWDRRLLVEAEQLLLDASRAQRLGPFQLEAAIQSAHVDRRLTGRDNAAIIVGLYDGLIALAPTLGALVARAAALLAASGPDACLAALGELDASRVAGYQPYHAVLARALDVAGRTEAAAESYRRAMGLCEDAALRTYLLSRLERLSG